ncbi:hypothetical protein NW762_010865 [Fusarium torreyae]|uniref:Uncharacterized protein n=1 Tax=Fusarium torreyae TaxID=1237075 RepID=A0A9W8RR49_9HYPO|nr:hypothetical protein NW762_010865 [Fusarium torreyae]
MVSAILAMTVLVLTHEGGTYGSGAIDEGIGEVLRKRLKPHRYLEQNGITIEGIVRSLVHEFKTSIKPGWDMDNKTNNYLDVIGLVPFPGEPNVLRNRVVIRHHEIKKIFLDVLSPIKEILLEQLTASRNRGLSIDVCHLDLPNPFCATSDIGVQRVVVMGGFADSPTYQKYLRKSLDEYNEHTSCAAEWYHPTMSTVLNAVAGGGVIRAANKANGPQRIARSSYGLGRFEHWDAKLHKGQTPIKGYDNEKPYARTIDWMVKLGEEIEHDKEYAFECEYTFPSRKFGLPNKGPFELSDEVWVSDTASQSHLDVDGEHNKGSECLGLMKTDVTHLRRYFETRLDYKRKRGKGKVEWLVLTYHLVFKINGLNMNCRQVFRFEDGTEIHLNNLKASLAPGINLGAS